MNILSKVKRFALVGIITGVVASIGYFSMSGAFADISLSGDGQNCDANAVVYCGATSASQLATKYNNGDGHNSAASIHSIYSYFGISSAAIQAMPTDAVAGSVTKSGQVYVGSQLVATNALTAGRQNISGSAVQSVGGTTFYTRAPAVSFLSNSLTAYVVMNNGQFQFAVLSSCGNPVKATPSTPPTPKPKPVPPVVPKPVVSSGQCTNLSLIQSTDNPRQVIATVDYSVQNGATLMGTTFVWGDGSSSPPTTQTSESHTFQKDGSYTVRATLTFAASPHAVSSSCQAPITAMTTTPTCDELDTQLSNDTVTVTGFKTTNNDATFNYATVDWGDGSQPTSVSTIIGQSHSYNVTANSGPYTITTTAHFTLNGQSYATTSQSCQRQISFSQITPTPTPTPPPATPVTVVALVNTGAGNVIAIFAVATIIGTVGYRTFLRHRFGRSQ